MGYIGWALLGMIAYSLVTLLVKLATRSGELPPPVVLTVATLTVGVIILTLALTLWREQVQTAAARGLTPSLGLAVAAGVALAVAVSSLFVALGHGPASTVVPIYGMFIAGGAVLGMLVLHEPVTLRKLVGLVLAVVSIVLIAGGPARR
jgi:transporter family protein